MKTRITFKSLSDLSLDASNVNGAPARSMFPSPAQLPPESVRDPVIRQADSASADSPRLECAGMAKRRPRRVPLLIEFRKKSRVPAAVLAAVLGRNQREQIEQH